MSESITVIVNNMEQDVPCDFGSTANEFLEAVNYPPDEYDVYRNGVREKNGALLATAKCSEPMVVSEGDKFTVIPKYVTGGG